MPSPTYQWTRALGVHQVELVVEPSPGLADGGGVGQHTHSPLHLGHVPAGHHSGRLVVDPDLGASWAPVHKLHCSLVLDGSNGRVDVLGHHVAPVEKATGHVLAVPGVTLNHL